MMNVVVIRRPREDSRSKTGLGRYADSIEDNLASSGADYSVVEASITLTRGFFHGLKNGILVPLKQARHLCRGGAIVHATDELCGVFFPFIRGKRILTIHHVVTNAEGRGWTYKVIWNMVTRISVGFADEIIAISPNTADDIRRVFGPKVPIHVIFNKPSDYYHRDDSIHRERVVGVVAELISRKNVSESIEAFRILVSMDGMGDLRMRICGRGLEKDDLVSMVDEYGLGGKVEFVDGLTDEEMFRFYNSMALLFNTSLHEGVGMVSLEANLCGTPSLCLERADIPSEVTAASVKCEDANDMAQRASELLADPEMYENVSKKSIEAAVRFGEGFSESLNALYRIN